MLRHEEEVFEEMYDRFPDEYSQVGGIPTIKATYLYKGVASFLHEPHYVLRFMVMVKIASIICCVLKYIYRRRPPSRGCGPTPPARVAP